MPKQSHPGIAPLISILTRMRVRGGQTQQEVADDIGISVVAVSYIENGQRTPRLETLMAYADAVGADVTIVRRRDAIRPRRRVRDFRGISRQLQADRVGA